LGHHLGDLVALTSVPSRSVCLKAFEVLSVAVSYIALDITLDLLTRFASGRPESSAELIYAIAEFLQSGIARLAREEDKTALRAQFPPILRQMLLFLPDGSDDLKGLVNVSALYGIHACAAGDSDLAVMVAVVDELTAMLSV
jgi:hypothetical protein